MNLQAILDLGGAIEISKNNRSSVREKDCDGKPFRISVELPQGYRAANSGISHVSFIFPSGTDFVAALMRVDAVIVDSILPHVKSL